MKLKKLMKNLVYIIGILVFGLSSCDAPLKLKELDNSLAKFQEATESKSDSLVKEIRKKESSSEQNAEASQLATSFSKQSQELVEYIEGLKEELIQRSGGYDEQGQIQSEAMKNVSAPEQFFLTEGKGADLQARLEAYENNTRGVLDSLTEVLGIANEPLAPFCQPIYEGKTWAEETFSHTPMIAALAYLTEKQSRVASTQKEVLELIFRTLM